ncbi:hypothetical protein BDW59DRAFT_161450 [Aspergillus cavernicola]|uniref:Pyridoxal phosphate-dependent transferase n=1 Tax=Aspergillus cavernicola TaxID=176166 RepID=A0ABR4IEU7_9EURO
MATTNRTNGHQACVMPNLYRIMTSTNSWGCIYTGESTLKNVSSQNTQQLFQGFFQGYYPISLHAHVSDALLPTTVASLVLNTCSTSPVNELHVNHPKFAAISGIYGAAFGPLAHASKEWEFQIIASGPKPVLVPMTDSAKSLQESLAEAKRQGCVAVVVDMVSTENGAILSPERFKLLKKCCAEQKMWLIVDEALTAIRCGAPFAFQRDKYGEDKPDLVSFGKGLGVSGIAISFDSPMTRPLGFVRASDILQTIMCWRALVSRPVVTPVLLDALGVLYTAQMENWPKRSLEIRDALCKIVQKYHPAQPVYGLGEIRRRCPLVRWLPKLDASYSDPAALEAYVFDPRSKKHRDGLAAEAEEEGTRPAWCFVCGIESTAEDWCRTYFLCYYKNAHTCV